MKPIELLVQETLNGNFKWPYGVNKIHQDYDGELRPDCGFCNLYIKVVAENHRELGVPGCDLDDEFFVTREQYEAALAAAQQPVWDGEGLPPVGCECEAKYRDAANAEWVLFRCVGVDCGVAFGWAGKEAVTLGKGSYEFRPIRSEADKKRAEIIEEIAYHTNLDDARDLYEAIAAGQVKGVKLDV